MALYEMRTYTLYVGKMAEATKLYQELGFPALQKGGHDKKLIGYFQGDTGTINQLVHLWKFDDDADRRKHWAGVFANKDFVEGFASRFRPLVMSQEVKLLDGCALGSASLRSPSMTTKKMHIGMSIRGLGYHPAAWRHPDVPADGTLQVRALRPQRAGRRTRQVRPDLLRRRHRHQGARHSARLSGPIGLRDRRDGADDARCRRSPS